MSHRDMLARPAPIVILLGLISLVLYWPTVVSLYQTWTNPSNPTYSHGLLLVTISMILLYRQWKKAPVELNSSYLGLLALAATSFVWLLAYLGQVQIVQQLSLLAVIGFLLWAVLGYRNARGMAFPLLLLLFAMPFWEVLNDYLQYLTAHTVTLLLNSTGVISVLDEVFIIVPAGTFEVTAGCSGLAQLIVALMVAVLYGHINKLPLRQTLRLATVAMLVAFATNTLRIYIVVVAGQLTNMEHYFVRKDHWTLGWILFGIAMFMFLLWANRYVLPETTTVSQPEQGSLPSVPASNTSGPPSATVALRTAALAFGLLAVGPILAHVYAARQVPVPTLKLAIPKHIGPWDAVGSSVADYRPRFHGANVAYDTLYRTANGKDVYLYVAYYARQEQGKEAVYYLNKVYDGKRWRSIRTDKRQMVIGAATTLRVEETRIQSKNGRKKIVWQWYYVNGARTSNGYMAKILNVLGALRGKPDIAVIIIAATLKDNDEKTRALLKNFLANGLEKIERGINDIKST
jgi:EpsI family protein